MQLGRRALKQLQCQVSGFRPPNDRIQAGGVTVGLNREGSRNTRLSRIRVASVNSRYGALPAKPRPPGSAPEAELDLPHYRAVPEKLI